MFRKKRSFILVISILTMAILIAGCSSSPVSPEKGNTPPTGGSVNGLIQSSTEGAVTIEVEWLANNRDTLVFDIAMNTHSVNLDQYDLKELTFLRDEKGAEYRPLSWNSAPGGHHRTGRLTFALPTSLSQGKAKYFELHIGDVAGVKERVLKWEL